MLPVGTILFGGEAWLWPAAALLAVALAALAWGYRRAPAGGAAQTLAAVLKAVGLAALAFFLIEPLWSGTRARPGANLFLVVADNSQSLRVSDRDQSQTRGQQLAAMLNNPSADWAFRINEDFDVRRYAFDTRLTTLDDFKALTFDGRGSSLLTSIQKLAERYEGRPVAGVLLFTDGSATDVPQDAATLLAGARAGGARIPPIYPVVIGADESARDLGIRNVQVSQTAFEDAPVNVSVDVVESGFDGEPIVVKLVDESDQLVASQTQTAPKDGRPIRYRFQLKPEHGGATFYRAQVSRAGEAKPPATGAPKSPAPKPPAPNPPAPDAPAAPDAPGAPATDAPQPPPSDEATLVNNTRLVMVDRGSGPYRVLYVAGRPNWEYKFLHRAVAEDEQVQVVALLRIARREPKFAWRARGVEQNNPLFRGFDRKDEEAERYDEPVLVRLDTLDENELRGGFPKTTEDLYKYHAVIIDDLEAGFFKRDQMAMLEKFVSQRGGGLMMLGGAESYQEGQYRHTPIGQMLPVYLDGVVGVAGAAGAAGGIAPDTRLRLELTREGWLQPWVRLRGNEVEERKRLADMPDFATVNTTGSIKPGASILATAADPAGKLYPALVVQRYGNGRCAAVTVGDLWRWALKPTGDGSDAEKAWRQMLRWLVGDVPGRVSVEAHYLRDQAQMPLRIAVRARDAAFKPMDNAQVSVAIKPPAGDELTLRADASADEAGLYLATYMPRAQGAYRATVTVNDGAGTQVDRRDIGWTADPAAEEFASLRPNRALLEAIARESGGEVVALEDLDSFAKALPTREAPIKEMAINPLWHTWWMFALAIACLVGEWGLRRTRGLP